MAYLDNKFANLNKKCAENNQNITDTQIGLVEAYEKTIETDSTVTDMQIAMVELYEMIIGGM